MFLLLAMLLFAPWVYSMCPTSLESHSVVQSCVATCLELNWNESSPCLVNYDKGGFSNEPCKRKFRSGWHSNQSIIACDITGHMDPKYFDLTPIIKQKLCTHLIFSSWFHYNSVRQALDPQIDRISRDSLVKSKAQENGLVAILEFGDRTDENGLDPLTISRMLANKELRGNLVSSMVAMTKDYHFDGLSFQWDSPGCPKGRCSMNYVQDKENFVIFTKQIFKSLHQIHKLLVLFIASDTVTLAQGVSLSQLVDHVDLFYMRSYYFKGIGGLTVEFHTPGFSLLIAVNYLKQYLSVPKMRKVLMGLSAVTPNYRLKEPIANPRIGADLHSDQSLSFNGQWGALCLKIKSNNYTIVENTANQNMAHNTKEVVVFDNFNTYKYKIDYFLQSGVRGIIFGDLQLEDVNNTCGCGVWPKLRMVAELLNGNGCSIKSCP